MPIYPRLSEKAISKEICGKIQLELTAAAAGIVRIVNSIMAKVLRIIVVPFNPGMFSAYGLLTADFKSSHVNAVMKLTTDVDAKKLENIFRKLELKETRILGKQRVSKANTQCVRQLDLRYSGQSYELTVPANTPFTDAALQQAVENFHKKHKAVCGYAVRDEPVELVNLRLTTIGLMEKPRLKAQPSHGEKPSKEAVITKRKVFFEQYNDYVKTPIYRRDKLNSGNVVEGPAVIEQYDATTVVYPRWKASVDKLGNLVLTTQNGGT